MEVNITIRTIPFLLLVLFHTIGYSQGRASFEYSIRSADLSDIVFPCPLYFMDSLRESDVYDSSQFTIEYQGKQVHVYYKPTPSIEQGRNGLCILNTLHKRYTSSSFTHTLSIATYPDTIFVHSCDWNYIFTKGNHNNYKLIEYTRSIQPKYITIKVAYYSECDSIFRIDDYELHKTYLCHRGFDHQHDCGCRSLEWTDGMMINHFYLGDDKKEERTIIVFDGINPLDVMTIEDEYNECNGSSIRHDEMVLK